MMAELKPLVLGGCHELTLRPHLDARGSFLKVHQASWFERHGLSGDFVEHFVSWSRQGVLRGMHFQVPPAAHAKLVTCLVGQVFDALVDLRVGSPTYGRHATVLLDAQLGNAVYVPVGIAHGFLAMSSEALVSYHVTSEHVPDLDRGVHWDSAGIAWPVSAPIVSARDAAHPPLSAFMSPFRLDAS